MNYQDYIWDLGGTLLDNYGTSTAAFVHTLEEFGLKAGHDEVYKALKVSTDHAVSVFAPEVKGFVEHYRAHEAQELEDPILFAGAKSLLEKIVAEGGRNFLVSHRNNQVLTILGKAAIAELFTEVVTADAGFNRKPDPQSINYLKEKYQIQSGLVIGDRSIDIEAGQRAGLTTYFFDNMEDLEKFIEN